MKNSELIALLQQYPDDTPVLIFDRPAGAFTEPELQLEDVIAVTEFGCEKICDPSRKWQYSDARPIKALVIK